MLKQTTLAALALTATFAAATSASAADAYFGVQNAVKDSGDLTIGYVNSPADGVIEIYDYDGSVKGRLLGTEAVKAGGNINTEVDVTNYPASKVIAVLKVGGQELATKTLYVND